MLQLLIFFLLAAFASSQTCNCNGTIYSGRACNGTSQTINGPVTSQSCQPLDPTISAAVGFKGSFKFDGCSADKNSSWRFYFNSTTCTGTGEAIAFTPGPCNTVAVRINATVTVTLGYTLSCSPVSSSTGQTLKQFGVQLSTYEAGQYPSMEVTLTPSHDLIFPGNNQQMDSITISVKQQYPDAGALIFQRDGPSSVMTDSSCQLLAEYDPAGQWVRLSSFPNATSTCYMLAGDQVEITFPMRALGRNLIVGTVVWLQAVSNKDDVPLVAAPYAASSGLIFNNFVVTSLVAGTVPSSAVVNFTLGQELHPADTIQVHVEANFFTDQAAGAVSFTAYICNNTARSNAYATNRSKRSNMIVTLEAGCHLPAGRPLVFTISSPFLGQLSSSDTGKIIGVRVATSREPTEQRADVVIAEANPTSILSLGPITLDTYVAGEIPKVMTIAMTLNKDLGENDKIFIGTSSQWVFRPGSNAVITTNRGACSNLIPTISYGSLTLSLSSNTCPTLANGAIVLSISGAFWPNAPRYTTFFFGVSTTEDTAWFANYPGYTTTAGCGVMPLYTPGNVADIASMQDSTRTRLASQIGFLAWGNAVALQCARTTELVTFVKIPHPEYVVPVSMQGTPAISIMYWGCMRTVPMEAIVVSYPPTATSLSALGISPSVQSGYRLLWVLKLDIFNNTGGLWKWDASCTPVQFTVQNVETTLVLLFEDPGTAGVQLRAVGGIYSMFLPNTLGVQSRFTSAFVGFGSPVAQSPIPDSGSDAAWLGFLAFIALPVCCLPLLALLAYLLWRKRSSAHCCMCSNNMCAPCVENPVCMDMPACMCGCSGANTWSQAPMAFISEHQHGPIPIPMPAPVPYL